jgi:hypothetical protein
VSEVAEKTADSGIDNAEKSIDNSKNSETKESKTSESAETAQLKETYGDTMETKENDDGTIDEETGFEEKEVERIPTRNEALEGQNHPETDVPFEARTVENADGEMVEVVVPEFDSKFDAQLPEELYTETDYKQFKECNSQLADAIENDSELSEQFTPEQREQIADGETPDGYTWHHDAEKGKMQLVDSDEHAKTGHTGGREIWGGGSDNR